MYILCKGNNVLIKKLLKTILKITIEILKFPFKMVIIAYYINIGKVDDAEDVMNE